VSARPPKRSSAPPPRPPSDSSPTILREGPSTRPPPGATTTGPSLAASTKAVRHAVWALGAFSGLTALALAAWFASEMPWGLPAVVTILALVGGVATAALLWKNPQRPHAYAALGVMGFSIVRVGLPTQWNWTSIALITLTAILAVPVAQAAMVLPRT
jgi:hypothetical protein